MMQARDVVSLRKVLESELARLVGLADRYAGPGPGSVGSLVDLQNVYGSFEVLRRAASEAEARIRADERAKALDGYGGIVSIIDNAREHGTPLHVATRDTCAEHIAAGDDKAAPVLTEGRFLDLRSPEAEQRLAAIWESLFERLPFFPWYEASGEEAARAILAELRREPPREGSA